MTDSRIEAARKHLRDVAPLVAWPLVVGEAAWMVALLCEFTAELLDHVERLHKERETWKSGSPSPPT
jgi:hypothetical protein